MSRIALVVRRVGGLEDAFRIEEARAAVVRRVGGLEVLPQRAFSFALVVRRVGGSEGQRRGFAH